VDLFQGLHNLERVSQNGSTTRAGSEPFAKTQVKRSDKFPAEVLEFFWLHLGLQVVEVSHDCHELHYDVNRNNLQ
jgi:hypothetical protein